MNNIKDLCQLGPGAIIDWSALVQWARRGPQDGDDGWRPRGWPTAEGWCEGPWRRAAWLQRSVPADAEWAFEPGEERF